MPAITKRTVDAATPGQKNGQAIDAFLWDGGLKGFGLKVTAAGAKVYIAQYRRGGRGSPTQRVTIGRHGTIGPDGKPWTPDTARRKAMVLLGAVEAGGDPAAEQRAKREAAKRPTVDDDRSVEKVAGRWFNHQRRHGKRSADEVERSFARHVYPTLGPRRIETIKKADAYALYERLADAGKPPMGHQLARNLKALLSFAVDPAGLLDANPLLRLNLPELKPRERTLIDFHPERAADPAELVSVWRAADKLEEPRRTYVKVLILTLAREDEVGDMPVVELDGVVWRLPAARHKGKKGYDIPLPMQAVELIEALPKERKVAGRMIPNEYVFTGRGGRPIGDFGQLKQDLQRLSKTTGWRLHDLRRSGSSWIEEEFGGEIMHAALGHSQGDRLRRTYAHGSGFQRKRRALQAWADFVTGAAEQASATNVVPIAARA